jgi:hypothetical protein
VTARQSDGAGNASGASAPLAVTIDTTAPAAPVAQLAAASDSGTLGDNLTNDTTPTISGTGTSGDTINVTLPAGPVLTTTVAVNGTWSVTTGTVQASGANAVSVTATDPAGNVSAPTTFTITIDTTPPAAPSAPDLATASDTGTLTNDNITSDVTPTFTGTGAQAGASVTLYDTDGTTSLGTATADGAGAWSITASALAAGVHSVTARQADAAGNASVASAPLAVTIDTQGPTFGNALTVNEGFGPQTLSATTLAAADNVTAQGALTVTAATFQSGTGFVSGDVVINVAGGQATVTPNGGAANKNGNVVVALTMQDAAGNSTAHNVTITVTPVNDAPSGTDATLLTVQNNNLVFGAGSFGLTDAVDSPANALQGVVITTLPAAGQLLLNGAPVSAGQEVAAAEIVAGHLVFAPALNGLGTGYATFTFQVRDNGGTANGGVDLDSTPNVITIDVAAPLQLDAASGGDSLAALLPGGPSDGYLVLADNGSGLLGLSVGAAPAVALASPDAFAPAPPSAGGDLLSPGSEVSGSSLAYLA